MWYESTTSNTVIQNIGRGVRNENDYCTTFILDGCFTALFENTKDQYPIELRNRIKLLNG
jgi:Rad3-related DNA helicase